MMGSTVPGGAGERETIAGVVDEDHSDFADPWWMLGAAPTLLHNLHNSAARRFLARRGHATEQSGAEPCRSPTPSLSPACRR